MVVSAESRFHSISHRLPRLSVVTVCHRSAEKLRAYVESFLQHNPEAQDWIEFVFVENSGEDIGPAIAQLLSNGFAVTTLIDRNRGFGAGCNLGAAAAKGELLAFVNPDLQFLSPLEPLRTTSLLWGTVRQRDDSGLEHSIDPLPEFRSTWSYLIQAAGRKKLRHPIEQCFATGSFLLVRAELFRELGGFDERFFLYYEECELARRLIGKAGPLEIVNEVSVHHSAFGSHTNKESVWLHECDGFVTYCRVTEQPQLLRQRRTVLTLLGLVSPRVRARKNIFALAVTKSLHAIPDSQNKRVVSPSD